jgi:hypothetical protein
MSIKDCLRAGLARSCTDCKHNRVNAPDYQVRPTIAPTIRADLRCPMYVQVLKPAVRR